MLKTTSRIIFLVLMLAAVLALVAGCTDNSTVSTEKTDSSGVDSSPPTAVGSGTDQANIGESASLTSSLTLAEQYIVYLATTPAPTPRFLVNSANDTIDANPGDGVCSDGAGNCTLRAAIMEANASTGADAIALPAGIYSITIAGVDDTGVDVFAQQLGGPGGGMPDDDDVDAHGLEVLGGVEQGLPFAH